MNVEWALGELERHRSLLEYRDPPGLYRATYVGTDDEIAAQQVVVERIWARVLGPPAESEPDAYDPRRHERERTVRCIESIKRNAEIQMNLGDMAPRLDAKSLHPWVWEGARSLWQSNHFAEAVEAAAKCLNAHMQSKVGRRDVSEATLFHQGFSDDPPQPGRPRLRLPDDDDGKSARSLRRGVRSFAEGCYAALRNPSAHDGLELSEIEALERLAALSIVARWVDASEVATADPS